MRRLQTIILALVLICGTTEAHQFFKIPFLLQHFREHRELSPGLTWTGFWQIHYGTGSHPDDRDDQDDQELPFKSIAPVMHTDPLVIVQKMMPLSSPAETGSVQHIPLVIGYPADRESGIFRPPLFHLPKC